jgi:hypothetical protein
LTGITYRHLRDRWLGAVTWMDWSRQILRLDTLIYATALKISPAGVSENDPLIS